MGVVIVEYRTEIIDCFFIKYTIQTFLTHDSLGILTGKPIVVTACSYSKDLKLGFEGNQNDLLSPDMVFHKLKNLIH